MSEKQGEGAVLEEICVTCKQPKSAHTPFVRNDSTKPLGIEPNGWLCPESPTSSQVRTFKSYATEGEGKGEQELCGEVVTHLIAGASYFKCGDVKGHDPELGHRAAGDCFKHGRYLDAAGAVPQCPHWPDCIKGAILTASSTSGAEPQPPESRPCQRKPISGPADIPCSLADGHEGVCKPDYQHNTKCPEGAAAARGQGQCNMCDKGTHPLMWRKGRLVHHLVCKSGYYPCTAASAIQETPQPTAKEWYSRNEIAEALRRMKYAEPHCQELADWFLRHIRLAFSKGQQLAANRETGEGAPLDVHGLADYIAKEYQLPLERKANLIGLIVTFLNVKSSSPAAQPRCPSDAVVDAAVAFILNAWAEAVELKGSESASYPVEFMNLHDAVCELKGWEPQGEFPILRCRLCGDTLIDEACPNKFCEAFGESK